MNRVLIVLIAVLATGCSGGGGTGGSSLPKVLLKLNWFPEHEHGGYYAALVEGYFKDEGLDVEILRGGGDGPAPTVEVGIGAVAFGIAEADDVLMARQQDNDVVAILAPFQQTPICIMVHEKSGIKSLKDLRDLTLAVGLDAPYFLYLKKKLPLTNVKIEKYTGGISRFLLEPNFAQQGFAFSEPILARNEKSDPLPLLVSEVGYNPYANVLIVRRALIRENPELVRKMVRASVRGWKKYLEDPAKANAAISKANPVITPETLAEGAKILRSFALDATTEKEGFGTMSLGRWKELLGQLEEIGQIAPGKVKPEEAFDTQFLPK